MHTKDNRIDGFLSNFLERFFEDGEEKKARAEQERNGRENLEIGPGLVILKMSLLAFATNPSALGRLFLPSLQVGFHSGLIKDKLRKCRDFCCD